ncbi:GxxExxY protein [Candidatus Wolfebacteria bacterium]|nr:GxxExxY protein [Candidatus Wolfebacteria bacterium]
MHTNTANKTQKLIHPELSYTVTGICFQVHNEKGRYARERQYGDCLARKLDEVGISYIREFRIADSGNIVDFLIDEKIILELKVRDHIGREDYYQLQRYLQTAGIKLGLIINFRQRYLKPVRVVRIETDARQRFV